ncbi:MAG: hypothetical protein Fues2KO_46590 [Fuerstiella sp.]
MMMTMLAFQEQAIDAAERTSAAIAEANSAAAMSDSGSGTLMLLLTIFLLAVLLGFEIITKIPPTLHTPLMSGSNAISGITLLGAILATGSGDGAIATGLGFVAVVFATMNVVGGFVVTNRMLSMFRSR